MTAKLTVLANSKTSCQGVRGIELHQSITRLTCETIAYLEKRGRSVQGTVDWYCVGPVDCITPGVVVESN